MERHQTAKAQMTRASLVRAAAEILRENGPSGVSYRKTAERAGAAPSSVGYYFDSIEALLLEAAQFNIGLWLERAEEITATAEALPSGECLKQLSDLLVRICLPEGLSSPVGHFQQIVGAGNSKTVIDVYRSGRLKMNDFVMRILSHVGYNNANPRMISSILDGAAILAISEGSSVQETARQIMDEAIRFAMSLTGE